MHMTSMTRQYSTAASHARNAVDKTADFWTEGARTVTDRLPGLPQVDLVRQWSATSKSYSGW